MSNSLKPSQSPTAKRVTAYRERMREAGLVAKTIWVPDTKNPEFLEQYRREARSIAADEREAETMNWIEKATEDIDLGPIPTYRQPDEK